LFFVDRKKTHLNTCSSVSARYLWLLKEIAFKL